MALTAVAFGPLVPGVFLPSAEQEEVVPGTGNASVLVDDVPDELRLEEGSFGDGMYHLQENQVLAEVEAVDGNPILGYNIYIANLGFGKQSYRVLSPDTNGAVVLTQDSATFPQDEVVQNEYQATLTVFVREADGKRVIVEKEVTVIVE